MNPFTYMEDRTFSKGRDYLGASDMPTLTGINSYQTPLELWEILSGRAEAFAGNKRSDWGHRQEPLILGEYVRKIYASAEARNDFITSRMWGETQFKELHSWTEARPPGYERLCAHGDLLDLTGETPILIQAKNMGAYAASQRKRDANKGYDSEDLTANGIPLSVYFQEQWELFCYGIERAYVAVLIDGWDWQLYGPIVYNKKTVENLLSLSLRMIWHVDKDEPPTPQTWSDVVKLNPVFKPATKAVVSDDAEIECRQMLEEHAGLKLKIKEAERRTDDITNALGLYIGGNQYLETPDGHGLASASEIQGQERVSLKTLREFPEIMTLIEKEDLITRDDTRRQLYVKGVTLGVVDNYTLLTTDDGEKWKRSRKKYSAAEKKGASDLLKSLKIDFKWEKVG